MPDDMVRAARQLKLPKERGFPSGIPKRLDAEHHESDMSAPQLQNSILRLVTRAGKSLIFRLQFQLRID
ncbi:MAG: hypothetical protein K9K80_01015 [Spirochaetia bacterium]|nr:hypothetical protein [Spirochaetia bacterium]